MLAGERMRPGSFDLGKGLFLRNLSKCWLHVRGLDILNTKLI